MLNLLVTGGSGFIGKNLAQYLMSEGHRVRVFDRRKPDYDVEHRTGQLEDLPALSRAMKGMDVVCHVGAIGDVYAVMERPAEAAQVNIIGTVNVLEAALRMDVARVIYTSTWEVYGPPQYQPIDESHPCRPDHPYNITKLAGESLALAYDRFKGAPAIALRLGTAYGPYLRSNSVISRFIDRAKEGSPLIIHGSGTQSRQFTHTKDIARAFLMAAHSEAHGLAINIVAPEHITIGELATLLANRFGTTVTYEDQRVGDIPSAEVSSRLAQDILGWKAETSFQSGLEELINQSLAASL